MRSPSRHLALIHLPSNLAPTLPRQARHIRRQAEALAVRNGEVQRACEELLALVAGWPRENGGSVRVPPDAANMYREYCAAQMYKVRGRAGGRVGGLGRCSLHWGACWGPGGLGLGLPSLACEPGNGRVPACPPAPCPPQPLPTPCLARATQSLLTAVKSSFAALRRRVASTAVGGALFLERPIFGVDLQLRVPAVVLSPSLDEIQAAINDTAKQVGTGCWVRGP